ncbi:NmrA family NAD(P)-binding protein [Nicoliella lavandulae]|uniref:NAD(P)H-binding protein n=1 Tax=Nicoliella lavandulae TaxID=3082954 RepID=A0ABU8SM51_9LACO
MKVLVTGASGHYGKYAVKYLKQYAQADTEIIALVRSSDQAQALNYDNVEFRIGDYSDIDSLKTAFEGIDRLLFVSVPDFNLQKNVVSAIVESNIDYVAYTSIYAVDKDKTGLEQNHQATERLIQRTGIDHTFLRNNWYLELIAPFLKAAANAKKFEYYAGDHKVAWALRREYAEAGAKVILEKNSNEILNLTGQPVSFKQLGEFTEQATGKKIDISEVDSSEFDKYLSSLSISDIGAFLSKVYQDYSIRGNNGEEMANKDTFEAVLGHPLTPLDQAISELIKNDQL